MADVKLQPLTPRAALRHLRRKVVGQRFSYNWKDVWAEENVASFAVAKAMRADILKVLHEGLEQAMSEGTTLRQFKKRVRPLLEQRGWWGFQTVRDPQTGEVQEVLTGAPHRLKTIYQTNLKSARASGRWERIQRRKKARPYLMYVSAGDNRVRPEHANLDGTVRPVDDPFWASYYPPNGFNCRCIVRQLSERKLRQLGLKVTTKKSLRVQGYGKTRPFFNDRTKKRVRVPFGVQPGFGYNVGAARLQPLTRDDAMGPAYLPLSREKAGPTEPRLTEGGGTGGLPAPRSVPEEWLLDDAVTVQTSISAFLDQFGGDRSVFFDGTNTPVPITMRYFLRPSGRHKLGRGRGRRQYTRLMAEALKDPDEIWAKVEMVDGRREVFRYYLANFQVEGQDTPVFVMLSERDGKLGPTTAFQLDGRRSAGARARYVNSRIRSGVRIYKREP